MGEFITTARTSFLIEKIIDDAKDFVILISPYIKIHRRLREKIERKLSSTDLRLIVICRNLEKSNSDIVSSASQNYQIFTESHLHAKCYLNENEAIISSLNLYDYSMINNIEFGVHFSRMNDYENYMKVLAESKSLLPANFKIIQLRGTQIPITEIMKKYEVTDFGLFLDDIGIEYLSLHCVSAHSINIKVANDVVLKMTGLERVKELVTSYNLYQMFGDLEFQYGY
jgi:hypothetical protein